VLDIVLVVVGSAIVLAVLYDLVATTVSLSAVRGPVSTRISALLGSIGSRPSNRRLAPLQRVLGPALLIGILVGWLTTLALGWSLVFSAEGALSSTTDEPQQSSDVRWVDALFFVFGRLVGTGSSDLEPAEAWWSTALAMLTLSGVILLTLVIAWILPVVAAVVQKRALASKISALGGTPQDIILGSWTGRDLGDLNLHLLPIIDELTVLAQRHLAYPVIHYFHTTAQRTAVAARIAALDEALTLIDAAGLDDVDRRTGLDVSVTRPLRQAISDYLSTLEYVFIHPAEEPPAPPPVGRLVEAGLAGPGTDREVVRLCEELEARRRLLRGYVLRDGWTWAAVCDDTDAETVDPEVAD
jgi:hypothetical protein